MPVRNRNRSPLASRSLLTLCAFFGFMATEKALAFEGAPWWNSENTGQTQGSGEWSSSGSSTDSDWSQNRSTGGSTGSWKLSDAPPLEPESTSREATANTWGDTASNPAPASGFGPSGWNEGQGQDSGFPSPEPASNWDHVPPPPPGGDFGNTQGDSGFDQSIPVQTGRFGHSMEGSPYSPPHSGSGGGWGSSDYRNNTEFSSTYPAPDQGGSYGRYPDDHRQAPYSPERAGGGFGSGNYASQGSPVSADSYSTMGRGYTPEAAGSGYGYPSQGGGYPVSSGGSAYANQPYSGGYGIPQSRGYPDQGGGYGIPQSRGYPDTGGRYGTPQGRGYPNQSGGYGTPAGGGYPNQGGGYGAPQGEPGYGYPSQGGGYRNQGSGGYPSPYAGSGYGQPSQGGGYSTYDSPSGYTSPGHSRQQAFGGREYPTYDGSSYPSQGRGNFQSYNEPSSTQYEFDGYRDNSFSSPPNHDLQGAPPSANEEGMRRDWTFTNRNAAPVRSTSGFGSSNPWDTPWNSAVDKDSSWTPNFQTPPRDTFSESQNASIPGGGSSFDTSTHPSNSESPASTSVSSGESNANNQDGK
ncbi:MAG: hypothetical protein HQL52_12965 [Magnetococcales bacterium]|nr:hypothetical protein [Magnetococcales bacterium]